MSSLQVDLYKVSHDKPLTKASEIGGVIKFVGDKGHLKYLY
ncbi:hypothetical protein NYT34_02830 [Staphylococcus aureus]|nr:hypothetical protein [Staphylococcus aureus]